MKYFLDTNLIIDFLDKKTEAIAKLTHILQDDDSEIFVNRLVYLETLRTISQEKNRVFDTSKAAFDMFVFLDINQDIYDSAIGFSRYCQAKGITLKGKCAAIDFLHFLTAKHYALVLLSNDKDMDKLADAYPMWLSNEQDTL
ncbi:MAG: PIN domain-containing protein [Methylobacter sp.]